MEQYTGKVWKCSFCTKISRSKGAMVNHEKTCKHNIINKTYCIECEHSCTEKKEYKSLYPDNYGEYDSINIDAPFCSYYKKHLIAPKLARQSWFKLQDDEMLMPVVANNLCKHFKAT